MITLKNVYWISTTIVALLLSISAWSYVFHQTTIEGIRDLGFPDYFRLELAVLKICAAVAILVPMSPTPVREWAYAGICLFIVTALIAHLAHRDSVWISIANVVFLILVAASYLSFRRLV